MHNTSEITSVTPISRLSGLTEATLHQLGFARGFLLAYYEIRGSFHLATVVDFPLELSTVESWQDELRELPRPLPALSPLKWMPPELQPAYALNLAIEDRFVGLLVGVGDPAAARATSPDERRALLDTLGQAIYLAQLYWQSERRLQKLQLIAEVNQRITRLLTASTNLDIVVQIVRDTFDYYSTSILLVDPDSRRPILYVVAGQGRSELTAEDFSFIEDGQGLVAWVIERGEPVMANDVSRDRRYHSLELLPSTQSEIAVPIRASGKTIGVLDVQSNRRNAFDSVDLVTLEIVANQVGNVLDNIELLNQERARRQMIQTLQEAANVISTSLDLERVLDLILRELGRVVSYDNVRLKQVDNDIARVIAARGFPDLKSVMGTTYRVSVNPLASMIVYEQQTISIPDVGQHPLWIWLPGTKRIRSWIGVPLTMKNEVIGLLSVSRLEYAPFSDDEVNMVRSFARHAAIAIENARLYNELKEFSATLELRVKRRTQQLERAQQELASVLKREVEVQETERIRIANELHDSVIQTLVAANFQLQTVKLRLAEQQPAAFAQLGEIQQMLDTLVAETKGIVHDLRPPALENLGLVLAIRQLTQRFHNPPHFVIQLQVLGDIKSLSNSAERTVYRVVQEALANALRHSRATHYRITLLFNVDNLEVILQDDGCGFNPADDANRGIGLISMHDRARSSGGTLTITSAPNQGTRIELQLPFSPADLATNQTVDSAGE